MFKNKDHIKDQNYVLGVIRIFVYYIIISTGNILMGAIHCCQSFICLFLEYPVYPCFCPFIQYRSRLENKYVYCNKIISRLCSFNGETFVKFFILFVYICVIYYKLKFQDERKDSKRRPYRIRCHAF